VEAVESHRFAPLEALYWRNAELDYASPAALLESLERRPPRPFLVRMRQAEDHEALAVLMRDPATMALARGREEVRLLWEVCQVPDFLGVLSDAHARLLAEIFRHLAGPGRRLPEDFVAASLRPLERTEGDLDTLLARLAAVRTWTFVSHRSSWLADAEHWQERSRAAEDRLSDELHRRLTETFVDRPSMVIARHDPSALVTVVTDAGEVLVQGLRAGRLEGFRFEPDRAVREGSRGLLAAANRALRAGARDRVAALEADPDGAFSLGGDGTLAWRGLEVARLTAAESALAPQVEVQATDLLDAGLRAKVQRRLAAFVQSELARRLAPLFALREGAPAGPARGLAFVVAEGLGTVARRRVAEQMAALSASDRQALSRLSLTLGRAAVFLPGLLRPEAVRLRAVLWGVRHGVRVPAPDGGPVIPLDPARPPSFYEACGYLPAAPFAVRADRLQAVAVAAARLGHAGPFRPPPGLGALLDPRPDALAAALGALGYRSDAAGAFAWARPGSSRRERRARGG
jgi:ATP-dependent RNA helicase SUPV3L1/SUV3